MPKKKPEDKQGLLVDNKRSGEEIIGGIRLELPLNRNLSWNLFGQLHNLLKLTSR